MQGGGDELVIQTRLSRKNWWILVTVDVGDAIEIDMVLDTGSPLSAISEPIRDRLLNTDFLSQVSQHRYLLQHAKIQGRQIPDLPVRVSRRITSVGADGILSLDFLARYTDIHFHIPSLRLSLG